MNTKRPQTYHFLSSRDYVKAFDTWAQETLPSYSHRAFARWAKVKSPNFIGLILSGQRHLQGDWLEGFILAAKLEGLERRYLETLVQLENADDWHLKEQLLEELRTLFVQENIESLVGDRLTLVREPLLWTLYYMSFLGDQVAEPKWFKLRLRRSVPVPTIRQGLETLERLGLLQRSGNRYQPLKQLLESPDEMEAGANAHFHRYVLEESLESLETLDPADRSFGSLTLSIDQEQSEALKKEISRFGKYLLQKYESAHSSDSNLVRLNLQLYPLTKQEKHS